MKSIKRGRAPSMMGGVMSLLIGLFGVAWTIVALRIGGGFMAVFGLIFVAVAVVQAFQERHRKKPLLRIRYHRRTGGARPAERAV